MLNLNVDFKRFISISLFSLVETVTGKLFKILFLRLGSTETLSGEDFQVIKRAILLYDHTSTCAEINRCRGDLFTQER